MRAYVFTSNTGDKYPPGELILVWAGSEISAWKVLSREILGTDHKDSVKRAKKEFDLEKFDLRRSHVVFRAFSTSTSSRKAKLVINFPLSNKKSKRLPSLRVCV